MINIRTLTNFILFLFIASASLYHTGIQASSQPPNIKEKKPIHGTIQLKLENIRDINDLNSNGKFFFTFIRDMAVDSIGNLYILDRNDIIHFSVDGDFSGTVAARGEGPGEYKWVHSISTDLNNNLIILDYRQILIFDKNQKHKETIKINFSMTDKVYIAPNRNMFGIIRKITGNRSQKVLIKFDRKGYILNKLSSFSDEATEVRLNKTGSGVMGGKNHPYIPDTLTCAVSTYGICTVKNTSDKLRIFSFSDNPPVVIDMSLRPHPISSKEMNIYKKRYTKNLKQIVFPSHRPFWHKLLGDDKGRIYAVRQKSIANKAGGYLIDIFSKDGKYLYNAQSPINPHIIWKGRIYTVDIDKRHNIFIRIYRIKDHRDLKTD